MRPTRSLSPSGQSRRFLDIQLTSASPSIAIVGVRRSETTRWAMNGHRARALDIGDNRTVGLSLRGVTVPARRS